MKNVGNETRNATKEIFNGKVRTAVLSLKTKLFRCFYN